MKHIVVHDDELTLECLSCHAVARPDYLPMEITVYVKWARTFEEKHRRCACTCKWIDAGNCAREKRLMGMGGCPCDCHRYVD